MRVILGSIFLFAMMFTLESCVQKDSAAKRSTLGRLPNVVSAAVENNQLIIRGSAFSRVNRVQLKNSSTTYNFTIESISENQIVANAVSAFNFTANSMFDLVVANAQGAATFPITFTMSNNSITAAMLTSMGASAGQILKYNGSSWIPTSFANPQTYLGAWDANDPQPTAIAAGEFFIVSVSNPPYNVGDWIVFNGTTFDHIINSSVITNVFGRTGVVAATEGDYVLDKMGDVDLTTTPPIAGDVLTYNGTKWVPGTASTGIPVGSITDAEISATAGISQSKISGLTTALAGKEPSITASTVAKYFRGDKTFVTLDTSVVPENTNLYFTNARVLGVPLTGFATDTNAIVATDTILQAFGKIQGQINQKSDSSSFIDWSSAGVQTIDPSRLSLGAGNADKALVTNGSGFVVAGGATTTEVGYLSGVTSAIQTQLNAKQATISNTTVQDVSKLRIYGANATNYVELTAAILTGNRSLIFPDSNGSNGNVLSTDGAGNLSWVAVPSAPVTSVFGRTGAVVSANGDYTASQITNTPAGTIAATTTQTAIDELDTEKQSIASFAADVRAVVVTGLSTATNAAIAATDSIVVAFGKLQAQISANNTSIANKADQTNVAQTITAAMVTGLSSPVAGSDATNKTYVDTQVASASNQWTASGGNVYRATGNVGIGVSSPGKLLEVNGDALISGLIVGRGASAVSSNTAFGTQALSSNTSGNSSVAVGYFALKNNTTGTSNTATGYQALVLNTISSYNTAFGYTALKDNTGAQNTAFGAESLKFNTTGTGNTAIGYNAGSAITTGSGNVVIGSNDGNGIASSNNNVIISDGSGAEKIRFDSSGNMALGAYNPSDKLDIQSGNIKVQSGNILATNGSIGTNLINGFFSNSTNRAFLDGYGYIWSTIDGGTNTANLYLHRHNTSSPFIQFAYGASAVGSVSTNGAIVSFNTTSDYRLKENIKPMMNATQRVLMIHPKRFNYISVPDLRVDGFIAHELAVAVPEAVTGKKDAVDKNGKIIPQVVDYSKVVPVIAGAIREFAQTIDIGEAPKNNSSIKVDSNGNVGIGTNDPSSKLDVQGGSINTSGGFTQTSDVRLKTNIEYFKSNEALEKITSLKGIYYDWRDQDKFGSDHQVGLIAQDVQKVFPEAVKSNREGFLSVSYSVLMAPVIEAVKELYSKFISHDKQLRKIAAHQDYINSEMKVLKEENAKLKQKMKEFDVVKAYLCQKDPAAPICK